MLSINDTINWINETICPIIPGAKTYGIAKTAAKDDKILPYTGDVYIGIDDTHPAQVYHKQLSISSNNVAGSGYGDNVAFLQNVYGMAMVVYYNEKKCGFTADKIYTFIQSAITGILKSEGHRLLRINVLSAILNDGQVWSQEYGQTPFKLSGSQRLIQINYSITAVFDKNCIAIPNCKN
jgi:hypothetical protein